ncbi:MAG: helix-turn-helix domain-containing protein [Clostridia bacterium]|nr:helix-turn-helix domain-containing protein [Clostridia bacterium]
MAYFDNLRALRLSRGWTQAELAKFMNIAPSTIAMYERGEREPSIEMLCRFADIFNVDMNALYGKRPASPVKIPVLGYVAAGIPIEAITDVLDYEEISPDMVKDGSEYFALRIKGDSMEPKISDGDVVIVRKQTTIDSGQIGIVCVNGDHATCKKVIFQPSGILLQPFNVAHAPQFYTADQVAELPITILGRVVELRAKF